MCAQDAVYRAQPVDGYAGTPVAAYASSAYAGPFALAYRGTGRTSYGPSAVPPTFAGSYALEISVPEDEPSCAGSYVINFSVTRAPLTFRARNIVMTVGDSLPELGWEVEGLVGDDRVEVAPDLRVDADGLRAGTYPIPIEKGLVEHGESYSIEYAAGTLTVREPSGKDPSDEPDVPGGSGGLDEPDGPSAAGDGGKAGETVARTLPRSGDSLSSATSPIALAALSSLVVLAVTIAILRRDARRSRGIAALAG